MKRLRPLLQIFAATIPAIACLTYIAHGVVVSTIGDEEAVYYPAVQNIFSHSIFTGVAPLVIGAGRLPGLPLWLSFFSLFSPNLLRAAQLLDLVAASAVFLVTTWCLRDLGVSLITSAAVCVAIATQLVFAQTGSLPLPDMATLGFVASSCACLIAVSRRGSETRWSPRLWVCMSGFLGGCAFLTRLNAVAILPAGLVGLYIFHRRNFLRLALLFAGGFLLATALTIPFTFALARVNIVFPHILVGTGVSVAAQDEGLTTTLVALLRSTLDGLRALPSRLGGAMSWFFLIPLILTTIRAGLGTQNAVITLPTIYVISTLLFLLPIHYEARYYLVVVPFAYASTVSWLVDGIGKRLPRVLTLAVATGGAIALAWWQQPAVREFQRYWLGYEQDALRSCAAIVEASGNTRSPVLVGAHGDARLYSRMLDCPYPTTQRSSIVLVPLGPRDKGVDFWSSDYRKLDDLPPFEGELLVGGSFPIYVRRKSPSTAPATSGRLSLPPIEMRATLPNGSDCWEAAAKTPPGSYVLEIVISTDPGLAGRVGVTPQGATPLSFWGAGKAATHSATVSSAGPLQLELCVNDRLRAGQLHASVAIHELDTRGAAR